MAKLTKNQKLAAEKIEAGKLYTIAEASALVKEITTTINGHKYNLKIDRMPESFYVGFADIGDDAEVRF